MGIYRIYPSSSNTIANGRYATYNSSQNAVANLWYGGGMGANTSFRQNTYSRFMMQFDLSTLMQNFADKTIVSGSVSSYKLKMTSTVVGGRELEREGRIAKLDAVIATSYDLLAFPINKDWDEGRGYDILESEFVFTQYGVPRITGYSNWNSATTLTAWDEDGIFEDPSASTINNATQHFALGNEDINMDVTDIVSSWVDASAANNGVALSFLRPYELISSDTQSFTSFFTQHTNTALKPHIEVNFDQLIEDDRLYVSNNRTSKLYLYTFSGDSPANYVSIGSVDITDNAGTVIYSGLPVNQTERGVYYVEVLMSGATRGQKYKDVWNDVVFNAGVDSTTFTQTFTIKDNYYQRTPSVNDYSVDIYGIENGQKIVTGDKVKIFCDLRSNYQSFKAPSNPFRMFYRIVMNSQVEVVPWSQVNRIVTDNCLSHYIDLDTIWLLHNQNYRVEFKMQEYGTNRRLPETLEFKVINPF
jgi:hypothetical protein